MKIPELPELTHRQADTILYTLAFIFIIFILPITVWATQIRDHQFYLSRRAECISQGGRWEEGKNKNSDFIWSCKINGAVS